VCQRYGPGKADPNRSEEISDGSGSRSTTCQVVINGSSGFVGFKDQMAGFVNRLLIMDGTFPADLEVRSNTNFSNG
jgi:hypothetical protein